MKTYKSHVFKVKKMSKIALLSLLLTGFAESVIHANSGDDAITKNTILATATIIASVGLGCAAYFGYCKNVRPQNVETAKLEKQEEAQEGLCNKNAWHDDQNSPRPCDFNEGYQVAERPLVVHGKKEWPHQKARKELELQRQAKEIHRQEKIVQNIAQEEFNYVDCGSL